MASCEYSTGYSADLDFELVHGVIGLYTESCELLDLLLKALLHDNNFDKEKLIDEAGDALWYLQLLGNNLGGLEALRDKNVEKLQIRYPDGFSEERANLRIG